MQLNIVGEKLGKIAGVNAMTDVTGFGLLGHLVEMAEGSGLTALVDFDNIPLITPDLFTYIEKKSIPGGTHRNWDSYGDKVGGITELQKAILADPQTSGGLLISVREESLDEVVSLLKENKLDNFITPIGRFTKQTGKLVKVQ